MMRYLVFALVVGCGGRSTRVVDENAGGTPAASGGNGGAGGVVSGGTSSGTSSTPQTGGGAGVGGTLAGSGGGGKGNNGGSPECEPAPISTGNHFPEAIAVEGEFVYWTMYAGCTNDGEYAYGKVWKARLDGSSPEAVAEEQPCPVSIAVFDQDVFFTTQPAAWGGSVRMAAKTGETSVLSEAELPRSIAADADYVFWSDTDGIFRLARADDAQPVLFAATPYNPSRAEGELVLDDGYVYWIEQGQLTDGRILRAPKTGGEPTEMARTPRPRLLAISSSGLFWIHEASFVDFRINLLPPGEARPTELASTREPRALVASGNDVYWASGDGYATGVIYALSLGKTEPFVISDSERGTGAMAVDSRYLYWANEGAGAGYDGEVVRACRPL